LVENKALAAGASAVVSKYDAVAVLIGKARELLDEIAAYLLRFPVWQSQLIALQNPQSFAGIANGPTFRLLGGVFWIVGEFLEAVENQCLSPADPLRQFLRVGFVE
jgi:hypothetical protein